MSDWCTPVPVSLLSCRLGSVSQGSMSSHMGPSQDSKLQMPWKQDDHSYLRVLKSGRRYDVCGTTVRPTPLGRPSRPGTRYSRQRPRKQAPRRSDTTGVGGKDKPQTRHSVVRLNVYLPPSGGFGTALLSRSDIPTGPLPSTLRGTLASGPKTGAKRGPRPPPGVCPRPNQQMPTKSPRRG